MPKRVTQLSDIQLRNAKPKPRDKPREYSLADGYGLYLRVSPHGKKTWVFNYQRPYTKRRNNLQIGVYPSTSLDSAREKRTEYRGLLSENIDPVVYEAEQELKKAEARTNTFEAVANKWFEVHKENEELTPSYAEDLINSLRNHVFPDLGEVPIDLVSAPGAISALQPLKRKGKLETIKRLCSRMNMIMNYAINTCIIPQGSNPLIAIQSQFKSPGKVRKSFPTIKPSEIPGLLKTIKSATLSPAVRNLFHWQLLNMTRPAEAAGARWEEIDWKDSVWVIPSERMKRKKEHKIPLTSHTLKLLATMKPLSGNREHIFPGVHNPRKHANNESVNTMLKRLGYGGKLVSHGLRAIASTTLNEAIVETEDKSERLFDKELIEVSLAHIEQNKSRGAYNYAEHMEPRRNMLQWWGDHIEEALTGKKPKRAKKHLQLAK